MLRNEKGITLIEVLLSLSIATIILGLVWSIFVQGIHFSKVVSDKTQLQQEANYIIRTLTKIHQTSASQYVISFDQNPKASFISITGDQSFRLNDSNYQYSIYISDDSNTYSLMSNHYVIKPNKVDLPIKIMITDVESPNLTYEVKTILSRIKGE